MDLMAAGLKEASPMSGPSSSGVDRLMTPRFTVPVKSGDRGGGR
jgi:hypothetical protein